MKLEVRVEGSLLPVVYTQEIAPGQLDVIRSILEPQRLDTEGNPNPLYPQGVCGMWGHMERGCLTYERHRALCAQGVGFSNIPGPTDREIEDESRRVDIDIDYLIDAARGK